ncbi:MAG: glycerophosphodiester phosphodiesterase [Bacteroidales bacterium]|jgi:glycerophosphoryl diester phosphodiesterase|nr:glycerophosphodiester phosphodiesterase [Bacteroidales bacterium]
MKHNLLIILIIAFISTGGCEKISYLPDNPIAGIPTKILMHRGCGFNEDFIPNTLLAAEYGLSVLDGVELDIQISKDGTLWLDHDNEVHDCDGNVVGCFQTLTDAQIESYSVCDGVERYNTVESVFQLMAAEYPASYISLDVKGQYCEIANTREMMNLMADAVLSLVEEYNLEKRVLVESSSPEFLEVMSDQSIVGQCFITFGDLDKGLDNAAATKCRGVSLEYGIEELNADVVDLVHQKGYGLVVWIVNEPEDIKKVWDSGPDFIETDVADFKDYISK